MGASSRWLAIRSVRFADLTRRASPRARGKYVEKYQSSKRSKQLETINQKRRREEWSCTEALLGASTKHKNPLKSLSPKDYQKSTALHTWYHEEAGVSTGVNEKYNVESFFTENDQKSTAWFDITKRHECQRSGRGGGCVPSKNLSPKNNQKSTTLRDSVSRISRSVNGTGEGCTVEASFTEKHSEARAMCARSSGAMKIDRTI